MNVKMLGFLFFSSVAVAAGDPVLNKNDRYKNLELFQKVLQFVEKNYVDPVQKRRADQRCD